MSPIAREGIAAHVARAAPTTLTALTALTALSLLGLACTPSREAMLDPVVGEARARTGGDVYWRDGSEADRGLDEARSLLLQGTLTQAAAVQVALLENRRLQATYEELGLSQGALMQAGLLKNPVFHAGVQFTENPSLDFGVGVEQDFLSTLLLGVRSAAAEGDLEATRARVSLAVVNLAADVRGAWVDAVSAQALAELRGRDARAAEASAELARRLRTAGNMFELDVLQHDVRAREAAVAHAEAQRDAARALIQLGVLMGVPGSTLKPPAALGSDPLAALPLPELESRALSASLQLAAAQHDVDAAQARLDAQGIARFAPAVQGGIDVESEEGALRAGPTIGLELPLFDQGQGEALALRSALGQHRARAEAIAVEVRGQARDMAVLATTAALQAKALDELVPVREQIVTETQRRYNAMLIGLFDVIDARRQALDAEVRQVRARQAAWHARIEIDRLLAGGSVSLEDAGTDVGSSRADTAKGHP